MRILTLSLLLVVTLSTFAAAQTAPLKFDEFTFDETPKYFFDDDITFKQRLNRLIQRLKLEPRGTKVFFIHYRPRVGRANSYTASEWRAGTAGWEISYKTKIERNDIVAFDGGVRDKDTLEIWIGGKNSRLPVPTPSYDPSDAIVCPSIFLDAQEFHLNSDHPAVFAVQLNPDIDVRFDWKVSAGRIIGGQGTRIIRVDVKELSRLKVTVTADSISNECAKETTKTFEIGNRPLLFDEFGHLPNSDIQARLDAYLTTLSNEPSFMGFIILYGRRDLPRTLQTSRRLVTNHFFLRNFPAKRVAVVDGGYRERGGMEIWLLPAGTQPPASRPTVDSKFVPKIAGRPKK